MRVNRDKSGVFRPGRAKFLGYTFSCRRPVAHPKSIDRLKKKLKDIFFQARGSSLFATIKRLNTILRGWRNYFQLDSRKSVYSLLDGHIRRHLRKLVWIAWMKPKRRTAALIKRGITLRMPRRPPVLDQARGGCQGRKPCIRPTRSTSFGVKSCTLCLR